MSRRPSFSYCWHKCPRDRPDRAKGRVGAAGRRVEGVGAPALWCRRSIFRPPGSTGSSRPPRSLRSTTVVSGTPVQSGELILRDLVLFQASIFFHYKPIYSTKIQPQTRCPSAWKGWIKLLLNRLDSIRGTWRRRRLNHGEWIGL